MPPGAEVGCDVRIEIPPAWERVTLSALGGTLLVVGAPDTGKSTFARYLYRRLCAHHERVAFVDGDVGQATLGPPTTMTLALGQPGDDAFPPAGPRFRTFVGDVSPRRHMLPTLVGAHKLVQKARAEGATAIVFDTTGLVDPACGGGELKRAKVELLRPTVVVGIQRGIELEHLLVPLRRSRRTRVVDLPASRSARRREVPDRQEHRAARFGHYFEEARPLEVAWQRLAVFPAPAFTMHRLVALESGEGFALALGIVAASDLARGTVTLHTPLASVAGADAIRLGDLVLDPCTFRELRL
jgi:polynucleotide 5'-hydroxyl-kinase GRC3/NOL9